MPLHSGNRLGPFEVLSPLGAGGMGEVYRARDTRLSRDVAIKVLPAELSADPSRLKRFEKEAVSASSLNHPNIVTLYEVGRENGTSFIAMELVEGKTLRALLGTEPMPIKRLLAIAAQIADGLSRAHASGIVHRDLKPENVMVTPDGHVKILDFGLAKLTRPELDSDAALTQTPTISADTGSGVVIGTVGYMSPEQACGRPVDFRSDQFSFGTILYEMATARRPFARDTAPEVLAAIIRDEPPPIGTLNPKVPTPLRWTVERCLAKEPDERYASTRDLARDLSVLRDHLSGASGVGETLAAPPRVRRARRAAVIASAFVLVAAAALFAGSRISRAPLPLFRPLTFRRGSVFSAKLAPDGKAVVFSAGWGGEKRQLYATRLDGPEALVLPHGEADVLAISSRGEMALQIEGRLAQAPLAGGGARDVLEDVEWADWSPDGASLAVAHKVGIGLNAIRRRLEYPIGKVLYETPGVIQWLRVSPRGDLVAFVDSPVAWDDRGSIAVIDRKGVKKLLTKDWQTIAGLAWSPKGDEIWFAGVRGRESYGEVRAVDLSGRERVVSRTAGGIGLWDVDGAGRALVYTFACTGSLFVEREGETRARDLSWFDYSMLGSLSPDGSTVVFSETGFGAGTERYATYIRKTDGSSAVRLGEGCGRTFSPDGKWVLADLPGIPQRLQILPVGAGTPRLLDPGPVARFAWHAWLPSGDRIFFVGRESSTLGPRIWVQALDGPPRPISPEGYRCFRAVTPDGRFIVARDPQNRLCLFPVEGGEPRLVPGSVTGEPIRVTADGRAVFVAEGTIPRRISRVDLATGEKQPVREISNPDLVGLEGIGYVDVTPDGKTFAYSVARCQNNLYLAEGLR